MLYLTPLEKLYYWEETTPDQIYLRQPIKGQWIEYSWKQTAEEVRKMAAYLRALNLNEGSKIAILSKNCAHWIIADLAIMMAGHVSVPLYPNLSAQSIQQIISHSESQVIFVGKLDGFEAMKPGIPESMHVISFPYFVHKEYNNWEDLVKNGVPLSGKIIPSPNAIATLIYTSGTTGFPKGVMHSFHSFGFACTHALKVAKVGNESRFFSYLPLSHIAERLLVEMGSLYSGGCVSFVESIETFTKNLNEVQPTVFLAVPRIWSKFKEEILKKIPQNQLNILLSIPIVSSIIKKKIKKTLGLSSATNIFSGAAPVPVSLLEWFKKIGMRIQEAYAMTENCCYSHVTLNNQIKIGYVGKALPYCEVQLSKQSEILIKHEALMKGYYKAPLETKEVFTEDGFFKTGDLGEIDADGFLKITGRLKELFKTSKGKYVAPSPIELKLLKHSFIEQLCVIGEGLPQPMALVIISNLAKKKTKTEVGSQLEELIKSINSELNQHEAIQKMVIVKDDWTMENGLLTPTLKIKRASIEKKYKPYYTLWYELPITVIWQ